MRSSDSAMSDRGQQAVQVLENPAYQEAMQTIQANILAKWKSCPIRDTEGQVLLLQMQKMADQFEKLLTAYIRAGRDAATRVELDSARNETRARGVMRRVFK